MTKTYYCPTHGEFDYECDINMAELDTCPLTTINNGDVIVCGEKVKRVYKTVHYSWKTDGFCGKGFA